MENLHSFIILAYKESVHLEKCIGSLLQQDVKSSIIITTSTPNSFIENISNKYGLPLIVNPLRKNIVHDWNFGLQQATTRYVTLCHQDDVYLQNYTSTMLRYVKKNENVLIAFSNYSEIYNNRIRKNNLILIVKKILLYPYLFTHVLKSKYWRRMIITFGSPICCPSVMYNKIKLPDFLFDDTFSINMDWNAWYRLSQVEGAFVYINKVLLLHRIHLESETSKGLSTNSRQEEDLRMFKHLLPHFLSKIIARLYAISYLSNKIHD